ncbi:hypothetical protein [Mycolicibacterium brisbanense]|nr:hypothetical protein [Mycolicibacterium brisbanense]MCV7162347.1 hypothetical protein [Mycolicibacterium brisbanense]
MRTNWISRLAENLRRVYDSRNAIADGDVDARRVASELYVIRARFQDHS